MPCVAPATECRLVALCHPPIAQLPIVDPAVFQAVASICQLALLAPSSSSVRPSASQPDLHP